MPTSVKRRALVVVEQSERTARLVASLTRRDRCAVAVTIDPTAELRQLSAHMLARLLRQDGYEAKVVPATMSLARRLPELGPLSFLVFDVGTRWRKMRALARHARARFPGLPIVAITSRTSLGSNCVESPFVMLRKPVDYAALTAALDAFSLRAAEGAVEARAFVRPRA